MGLTCLSGFGLGHDVQLLKLTAGGGCATGYGSTVARDLYDGTFFHLVDNGWKFILGLSHRNSFIHAFPPKSDCPEWLGAEGYKTARLSPPKSPPYEKL